MFSQLNFLRKIVGLIGNFTALCLLLSPTPTFVRIVKKKSVEKYSPLPYLATLINSMARLLYGLPFVHPDSTMIITLASITIVIEIVFLCIFFIYCGSRKQRLRILAVLAAEVVFMTIFTFLVLTLEHSTNQRTMIVGIVCCVFITIQYISPLSVMKMVIKTKSLEFMPFWLSVAGVINASVWTLYGFLPYDPYMAIPNGIGCAFGLVQLMLCGIYYKSTKRIMAESHKLASHASEVGLSEISQTENFKQPVNGV